jgi:hypothetical protein
MKLNASELIEKSNSVNFISSMSADLRPELKPISGKLKRVT